MKTNNDINYVKVPLCSLSFFFFPEEKSKLASEIFDRNEGYVHHDVMRRVDNSISIIIISCRGGEKISAVFIDYSILNSCRAEREESKREEFCLRNLYRLRYRFPVFFSFFFKFRLCRF